MAMLPSRCSGATKWAHEYTSPLASATGARRRTSLSGCSIAGGVPAQLASAASNICTARRLPTSRRTHSSKTSIRTARVARAVDRAVPRRALPLMLDDGHELDRARAAVVA